MKRLSHILAVVFLCCFAGETFAQEGNPVLGFESWGGYTSGGTVPFWLRSNQFGSVPLDGASLSVIGFARKDYDTGLGKLFDWGASFEGRANLGQGSNLTLIEGYGKIRLGIFELRAGRSKEIMGLCDTTLTSGSWAVSGTSLGVPEIELSVRDYWTLPWFGGLFAFKGNFAHGWMGDVQMFRYIMYDTLTLTSYLHKKSLYGRLGKPSWRLKLYGGFNHEVVWGSEQEYYLEDYTLTPLQTYYYVITGKKFSNGYIQEERQGNHLGSIDLGLEYEFEGLKLLLYRQSFYETGSLAHLANIRDGLNGLSLHNKQNIKANSWWSKIVLEFLYTRHQGKDAWSPFPGQVNYESYNNHGQYLQGWSYRGTGLGSPFIGNRDYIRQSLAADPEDYFINNRIALVHIAGEGSIKELKYLIKCSWSRNYGTYQTATAEESEGIPGAGDYGFFGTQKQLSTYLELNRQLKNGINFGVISAFDYGTLYYNSFGLFLKASYSFNL